jgi:hypothetical protein
VEVEEHYQVKVSNRFTTSENLDDDDDDDDDDVDVDINRDFVIIREEVKASTKERLGYYKLKQYMYELWFDDECSNH